MTDERTADQYPSEPSDRAAHDDRAARGLEHLQAAAQEMIEAARAFLDVVEDMVSDPEKMNDVVHAVGDVAGSVTDAARSAARRIPSRPMADDPDEGVQRIPVS